jgi:ligand-binding sensor domain-containing protein/signal transduction histidine kinase
MKGWFITLLLIHAGSFLLPAQKPFNPDAHKNNQELYFNYLTRENGLPSDRIRGVLQDFQGYIWIATVNGLARFDGKNCVLYQHNNNDPSSIIDNLLITIKESRDSLIWIGAVDGISVYNPFSGTYTNYSCFDHGIHHFPAKSVVCFYQDRDGSMWMGSENGLIHQDRKTGRFEYFKTQRSDVISSREYVCKHITCIIEDPRDPDKLFLATLGGLLQFDKQRKCISRDYHYSVNNSNCFIHLFLQDETRLWACGWGLGLVSFDLQTEKWKSHPYPSKRPNTILRIVRKSENELWLGTADEGLGVYNLKNDSFRFYKVDPLKRNSILSDDAISIDYMNGGKDIWISSDNGISILNRDQFSFQQHRVPFKNYFISNILETEEKGSYYMGAIDAEGLYVWNSGTDQWRIIPSAEPGEQKNISIIKLLKDSQSRLWVGSRSNLHYLDPSTGKLKLFRTSDGNVLPMTDPFIYGLYEDHLHNLWVGTRSDGIFRINSERTQATHYIHRKGIKYGLLEGTFFRSFREDRNGKLWVGCTNGLSIYDPQRNFFSDTLMTVLLKNGVTKRWISDMAMDSLGRMWLVIDGEGIGRVETGPGNDFRVKIFNTSNGLNDQTIGRMAIDPNSNLWFINYGLIHLNPYDGAIHLFNETNGLHNKLTVDESLYIDPEGNIFIGNSGSFETKNIRNLDFSPWNIKLILESVEINGKTTFLGFKKASPEKLDLKADQNNLTFKWSVICFQDAGQVRFRYKLEGYDRDWTLAGLNREVRYTNLPPGRYRFVVSASNRGKWLSQEKAVMLSIPQYFYRTAWFIAILVTLIASSVYLLFRYRVRQLLKVERLRTRIATDLHDDVGSTLSSIYILSDVLSARVKDPDSSGMVGMIGKNAKSMLEKLDDIIWVVNPSKDKFKNLGLRIREYAIPLFELKKIQFGISYDARLDDLPVPMEIRRNVYLIAKEAINNALKYSECTSITICFRQQHPGILMEINDNGKGFDPMLPTSRNGIKNMKQRAVQINGQLNISSAPGQGTRITLRIKTI